MPASVDLLQGTLDLIVLKALSWGPMHGFGLARWIQQTTQDVLQVEEGSLYPALYRMENRGWIKAQWAITENDRTDGALEAPTGRRIGFVGAADWRDRPNHDRAAAASLIRA